MTDTTDITGIDLREKLAHIDQLLADRDRKRQEIKYAPWLAVCTGMTAGAAFLGVGIAIGALLMRLPLHP